LIKMTREQAQKIYRSRKWFLFTYNIV
jgi:hypothetical protein